MPSFGLCGIILAAGQSSRMGRDKALLPWPKVQDASSVNLPPSTLLSSAIHSLSDQSDLVIVVAGGNAESLRGTIDSCGASLIENPAPERGQFSSLQVGLQEVLARGRDNAIVTLVDHPPLQPATLAGLVQAFHSRPHDIWAVIPEYEGKHGHPILVGREMIEAFLRAPITSNARDVEHSLRERIIYANIDDPFITADLDTPEIYSSVQSLQQAR